MNCCIKCFCDTEIRAIINSTNHLGNCDYCLSEDVNIYNTDVSNPIADFLISLIETYTVSDAVGAKSLKESLRDDWDVFDLNAENIQALTQRMCASNGYVDDELFVRNVKITESYLHTDHAVVRGNSWSDFSNSIKYKNRFHSDDFNAEAFNRILNSISKSYPAGSIFYRARISPDKNGHTIGKMGAPPPDDCNAGRINPEGIPVLYLASDRSTTLYEIRAAAFDYVSICMFRLIRDIEVVNLSRITNTSPFLFQGELEKYAINRKVFKEIASELAKPQRNSDSHLEYLPTQFIAEFIKSKGYAGVEYASTIKSGGLNLAIFNENLFDQVSVQTIEVSEIAYKTLPDIK